MSYIQHVHEEVHGFRVTDATSTIENHEHDDLVWLGFSGMGGRWLTPAEALDVARAIERAAASNLARRK